MKRVTFVWNKGYTQNDNVTEVIEFDDEASEETIKKEFESWVWEQIGDQFSWYVGEQE